MQGDYIVCRERVERRRERNRETEREKGQKRGRERRKEREGVSVQGGILNREVLEGESEKVC